MKTLGTKGIAAAALLGAMTACQGSDEGFQIVDGDRTGGAMPTVVAVELPADGGTMVLPAEVVDGMAIHQGDIALGPVSELPVIGEYDADGTLVLYEDAGQHEIGASLGTLGRLWPMSSNTVNIDYVVWNNCFSWNNAAGYDFATEIFTAVGHLEDWSDGTFEFTPHFQGWNPGAGVERIQIRCGGTGNWSSWIGMVNGGPQQIYLDADGATDDTVVHELGHALGLFHEHVRRDRDDHIEVHWDNIPNWTEFNFWKYTHGLKPAGDANGLDIGPINYDSIMMYDSWAWSSDGNPTMTEQITADTWWGGAAHARGDMERGGDLYTLARIYTDSLYISEQGSESWMPLAWECGGGGCEDSCNPSDPYPVEDFIVGQFCDDGGNAGSNNEDLLMLSSCLADRVLCDGGLRSAPITTLGATGVGPGDVAVGDFDAAVYGISETYTDLMRNDTITGEWELCQGSPSGCSWIAWNTLNDPVEDLGVGEFCEPYVESMGQDVIRVEPDGLQSWQVSCGASDAWYTFESNWGDPTTLKLYDFDGDGWTDLLRNHPIGGKLQVAFATPPSVTNPSDITSSFTTWRSVTNNAPKRIPVDELVFGDFDGDGATDLLYVDIYRWIVAVELDRSPANVTWDEINNVQHYQENPTPGMFHPLLAGRFSGVQTSDVATLFERAL
jgi:Astacin (Peptidase family M12A)